MNRPDPKMFAMNSSTGSPEGDAIVAAGEGEFGGPGSGSMYDPWINNAGAGHYYDSQGRQIDKEGRRVTDPLLTGGSNYDSDMWPGGGAAQATGPGGAPRPAAANGSGILGGAPGPAASPFGGGPMSYSMGTGGYELPGSSAASQAMRDLQLKGLAGLGGLLGQDTSAQRAKMERALYDTSAEGINTAADRQRAAMLEGTFGRGVGSSSITLELAGRGQQEQSDALARAARDAYTQAGAEQRADLASQLGLSQGAFNAATTGLQGEANVALANLARMQQESQFARNLGFQGGENALNRSAAASAQAANLGMQQQQLSQQASQFGQGLAFQGSQAQLNRDLSMAQQQAQMQQALTILAQQQGFQGTQADLNRAFANQQQQAGFGFQGTQADLNRAAALAAQQAGFNFTGSQTQQAQQFAAAQADLARQWQGTQTQGSQGFTAQQNQLNRDAGMAQLLLQIANQQQTAGDNRDAAAVGAGVGGATTLLGPLLAQLLRQYG